MMHRRGLIIITCCFAALSGLASACRFNVRDVGFVDLGSPPYQFYCLTNASTPADVSAAIKDISAAAFFNTNVEPLVLDQSDPRAEPWKTLAAPLGVLVSPDGERSLALPLINEGENLQDTLWTHMEAVFESRARSEILAKAIDTYGVVVLVEGPDATENARIHAATQRALTRIGESLGNLEKEIEKPPVLHAISAEEAVTEKVFLWSLGLDRGATELPVASVIYSRGRQIGQRLEGAEIEEENLFNVLRTIGLNCECGLDRSWMQGPMMPLKWDSETQARVARQLGFDAEDPLIKMEMSQILSKADRARQTKTATSATSAGDLEVVFKSQKTVPTATSPPAESELSSTTDQDGSASLGHWLYATLYLLGGTVLIAGLIILIRASVQNR